eukprot:3881463-Rhodomonas_salina.3
MTSRHHRRHQLHELLLIHRRLRALVWSRSCQRKPVRARATIPRSMVARVNTMTVDCLGFWLMSGGRLPESFKGLCAARTAMGGSNS